MPVTINPARTNRGGWTSTGLSPVDAASVQPMASAIKAVIRRGTSISAGMKMRIGRITKSRTWFSAQPRSFLSPGRARVTKRASREAIEYRYVARRRESPPTPAVIDSSNTTGAPRVDGGAASSRRWSSTRVATAVERSLPLSIFARCAAASMRPHQWYGPIGGEKPAEVPELGSGELLSARNVVVGVGDRVQDPPETFSLIRFTRSISGDSLRLAQLRHAVSFRCRASMHTSRGDVIECELQDCVEAFFSQRLDGGRQRSVSDSPLPRRIDRDVFRRLQHRSLAHGCEERGDREGRGLGRRQLGERNQELPWGFIPPSSDRMLYGPIVTQSRLRVIDGCRFLPRPEVHAQRKECLPRVQVAPCPILLRPRSLREPRRRSWSKRSRARQRCVG